MTRSTLRAVGLAAVLIIAVLTASVAPAAANHNEPAEDDASTFDQLFNTDDDTSSDTGLTARVSQAAAYGSGLVDRLSDKSPFADEPPEAAASAADAQREFNRHNASFIDYANDRGVSGGEVVEITFTQDGETATVYLVSTYNETTSNYTSAEVVNSTDRSIDEKVLLKGNAAANAAAEIDAFHDEFVAENRDVTTSYLSKQAGRYGDNVQSTMLGDDL